MIAIRPFADYNATSEVVSCLIWLERKCLFLRRSVGTYCPQTWGCPTGKIEPGESQQQAMQRELAEETGLYIPKGEFQYWETLYVRHPAMDFTYHLFSAHLNAPSNIVLQPREHDDCRWLELSEVNQLSLVPDMEGVLERYQQFYFKQDHGSRKKYNAT